MSEEEKTEVQEKLLTPIWKDFRDEKPEKGQCVIVLTKYGMHFYIFMADDPLSTMCGLFYISRDGNCSGLRYSIELSDIDQWTPLPVAY